MAKKARKSKIEEKSVGEKDSDGTDVEAQISAKGTKRKSLKKKKSKKVNKGKEPPLTVGEADGSVKEVREVADPAVEDEKKEEHLSSSQLSSAPPPPRRNEVPLDISENDEDELLSDPPARVARLPDVYEHMSAQQMMEDARNRLSKMDEMEREMAQMRKKLIQVQMTQEHDLEKNKFRKRRQTTDMTPPPPVTIMQMARSAQRGEEVNKYDNGKNRADYDTDEEEDTYEVRTFPRNTFSFLLLSKYPLFDTGQSHFKVPWAFWKLSDIEKRRWQRSRDFLCLPFWFAWNILVLQIGIYTLALYNAVDFDDSSNPFQFPINVDVFTRTTELLAVLITVYTQNNIFQGVDLFVQSFKYIGQTPGVTIQKYYLAALTQVFVGLYGVFVTFIIIMQSQEVVDLLLNFTAMEFVSALDDAAFELSLRGFVGHPMKKTAKIVRDVRYNPRDKRKWLRKWPLFMVLIAVLAWYIIVRVDQDNRKYGDNVIYIQLKDAVIPWLSTLSGTYTGCTMTVGDNRDLTRDKDGTIGRIFYSKLSADDCKDNWKTTDAVFFFCDYERWVLAVGNEKFDPCNKWSIRSFKADPANTDEYDILGHATADWFAKDPQNISSTGVLESIQFLVDFDPDAIDVGCRALTPSGRVFLAPLYERLEGIKIRDRPVYFGPTREGGELIFYNGGRWLTVKKNTMTDCVSNCTIPDTVSCIPTCLQTFDPYLSNYTVLWISDPMDLRTNSDTWIPTTALSWNRASSEGNGNAATPDSDSRSFLEKYNEYPEIARFVEFRDATEEQIDEARSLFLQSAKLSCGCTDDVSCEAILTCPDGGTRVWVDIKVDSYPEETCIAMKTKEASDGLFYPACTGMDGLTQDGVYDWGTVAVNNLVKGTASGYRSCLPAADCGVVYWLDSFGDGMSPPGSFDVTVNGTTVQNDFNFSGSVTGPTSCIYQFGRTCEQSVKCYVDFSLPDDDFFLTADDDTITNMVNQPEGVQLVYSNP